MYIHIHFIHIHFYTYIYCIYNISLIHTSTTFTTDILVCPFSLFSNDLQRCMPHWEGIGFQELVDLFENVLEIHAV